MGCAKQSREKAKSSMEKPSRLHHKVASGTEVRQPLHGLHNRPQERRTRQNRPCPLRHKPYDRTSLNRVNCCLLPNDAVRSSELRFRNSSEIRSEWNATLNRAERYRRLLPIVATEDIDP